MIGKKNATFDINEYEPLKKAREAYEETKAKIQKMQSELQKAKPLMQEVEQEASRMAVLVELGEVKKTKAEEAKKRADKLTKTVKELEAALDRAKMELKVKADIVKQKDREAREAVAESLRNEHKKAIKKLASLLAEAVKVNEEAKQIEEQWLLVSRRGGEFGGLPGMLPALSWQELTHQKFFRLAPNSGGTFPDTKYSLWLKELERYGYTD